MNVHSQENSEVVIETLRHELLNALGQIELEKSRVNNTRAEVLEEAAVKWGIKFEEYKEEVDSRERREIDELNIRIVELESDLSKEKSLSEKRLSRVEAAEEEVLNLLTRVEQEVQSANISKRSSNDKTRKLEEAAELIETLSEKNKSQSLELTRLKQEMSQVRERLHRKTAAVGELEATLSNQSDQITSLQLDTSRTGTLTPRKNRR